MKSEEQKDALPADSPMRDPQRRRAVRRLLRAEVFYLTAMAVFAALGVLAHFNTYFDCDLAISRGLQNLDSPAVFYFMRGVSVLGDKWVPWVLAGVAIILFFSF